MITLAAEPEHREWTAIVPASADPDRLGVQARQLRADAHGLEVALGPGLSARLGAPRDWPRRLWGPLGPASAVPWLGQYWAPHLLGATVTGSFGERSLDGALVYAEKNWGAAFARHWWWGQASFGPDAGVAFAGGRVHGIAPTAVAAWTPPGVVRLAPPFARTVARARDGSWAVRARAGRGDREIAGGARAEPVVLAVAIPDERRLEVRSRHHLRGRLRVVVRRGRRVWLREESVVAGLEDGAVPPANGGH